MEGGQGRDSRLSWGLCPPGQSDPDLPQFPARGSQLTVTRIKEVTRGLSPQTCRGHPHPPSGAGCPKREGTEVTPSAGTFLIRPFLPCSLPHSLTSPASCTTKLDTHTHAHNTTQTHTHSDNTTDTHTRARAHTHHTHSIHSHTGTHTHAHLHARAHTGTIAPS